MPDEKEPTPSLTKDLPKAGQPERRPPPDIRPDKTTMIKVQESDDRRSEDLCETITDMEG